MTTRRRAIDPCHERIAIPNVAAITMPPRAALFLIVGREQSAAPALLLVLLAEGSDGAVFVALLSA